MLRILPRRYAQAVGSFVMISIDCPSQCSTSVFLKSRPRLSLIQFSADSRGNWSCRLAILGSQAEQSVGVSRSQVGANKGVLFCVILPSEG
jgi:hypothetical protein